MSNSIENIRALNDEQLRIVADIIVAKGGGEPEGLDMQDRDGLIESASFFIKRLEAKEGTEIVWFTEDTQPKNYDYPVVVLDELTTLAYELDEDGDEISGTGKITVKAKVRKAKTVKFEIGDEVLIKNDESVYNNQTGVVNLTEDGGLFVIFITEDGEEVEEWFAVGDAKKVKVKKAKAVKVPKPKKLPKPRFEDGQVIVVHNPEHEFNGITGDVTNAQTEDGMVEVLLMDHETVTTFNQGELRKYRAPKPKKLPKINYAVGDEVVVTDKTDEIYFDLTGIVSAISMEDEGSVTVDFGDDVSADLGLRAVRKVKIKVVRVAKAKYKDGVTVIVTDINSEFARREGIVTGFEDGMYVVEFDSETVSTFIVTHLAKVKVTTDGKPATTRIRKLSDDVIREARQMRSDLNVSYAKIATHIKDTYGVDVTGDLIRSVCIFEIYSDVE